MKTSGVSLQESMDQTNCKESADGFVHNVFVLQNLLDKNASNGYT